MQTTISVCGQTAIPSDPVRAAVGILKRHGPTTDDLLAERQREREREREQESSRFEDSAIAIQNIK